jgi:predicted Zn finger-like uncharacterized protein
MPELSQCPSCKAKVRVPEHMLGKKVRCPKCQATFTAGGEGPAKPAKPAAPEEPAEPEGVTIQPKASSRRRRAVPVEEPEDEESARDEDEDEDRPRKRRRRPRRRSRHSEEAETAVTPPAICLMVLGGLNIALLILDIVLRFLSLSLLAATGAGQAPGNDPEEVVGNVVGGLFSVFGIFLAAGMIFGGYKMKRLEYYGLAMAVSILAMIPCWNCCLLGLPLGIWSVITLNRPEVKAAFTS